MATFENPNKPQQPQKGVYVWYAQKGDKKITIYVGQAGRKNTCLLKGTLFRGVSELQRDVFSSNQKTDNYSTIDTDFIVGTAIIFFEKNGFKCTRRHIGDNPQDEEVHKRNEKPILQYVNNSRIKEEFKLRKQSIGYWKLSRPPNEYSRQKIDEAENGIFGELSKYIT